MTDQPATPIRVKAVAITTVVSAVVAVGKAAVSSVVSNRF
jgi:hypothetical protein